MNIPKMIKDIQKIESESGLIMSLKDYMLEKLCNSPHEALAKLHKFNILLELNNLERIKTE